MPHKKRKVSDLSPDQISQVTAVLLSARGKLDELGVGENEDGVRELDRIIDKMTDAKHTPFSDVSLITLAKMRITMKPMVWRSEGEAEAKAFGNSTSPGALTVEDTRKNIHDVLKYVALESEAGCHILINALLIHVASNLETAASGAVIAPEFRVKDTVLGSTEHSFGGVVDYMLVYGNKAVRDEIIMSESIAFNNPEIYKLLRCNVYEAKPEQLFSANTSLPQAAIAAIIKAQRLHLKVFRGCVTSGKRWMFFIYNEESPGGGHGKTVHWLEAIPLGDRQDTTFNLDVILGILRDWVEHGNDTDLRFFNYPM